MVFSDLLATATAPVQALAAAACALVEGCLPDATRDKVDMAVRLVARTTLPGTYRGALVAVVLHKAHVNLQFARGVALLPQDSEGPLEGTGKQARHIKIRSLEHLDQPGVRQFLEAAGRLTE